MNPFSVLWNPHKDFSYCAGCGKPFKKGDKIYPRKKTDPFAVHYRAKCLMRYENPSIGEKDDL